mmetsp:Transcript_42505/g.66582  ORF Transcript_42505/g.66582 Transcript_42505/m.66582 type:complete len:202 (-) Transcript_42505:717-1322(-)
MANINGTVIAMVGKDCTAIASDRRLGLENITIGTNSSKIFQITKSVSVGMCGLFSDIASIKQSLEYNMSLYKISSQENVNRDTIVRMIVKILYLHRLSPYIAEIIVMGLGNEKETSLINLDCLGAIAYSTNFSVAGSSSESLYGVCEVLWKPYLDKKRLLKTLTSCFLHSIERDCISGWRGLVHLFDDNGISTKIIKTRMD